MTFSDSALTHIIDTLDLSQAFPAELVKRIIDESAAGIHHCALARVHDELKMIPPMLFTSKTFKRFKFRFEEYPFATYAHADRLPPLLDQDDGWSIFYDVRDDYLDDLSRIYGNNHDYKVHLIAWRRMNRNNIIT